MLLGYVNLVSSPVLSWALDTSFPAYFTWISHWHPRHHRCKIKIIAFTPKQAPLTVLSISVNVSMSIQLNHLTPLFSFALTLKLLPRSVVSPSLCPHYYSLYPPQLFISFLDQCKPSRGSPRGKPLLFPIHALRCSLSDISTSRSDQNTPLLKAL